MSSFDESQHPRGAGKRFTDKPQSAPETGLALTGADAATAAGLAVGVHVDFREVGRGLVEPGVITGLVDADDEHPNGGQFFVDLDDGSSVFAWWEELTPRDDLDVARERVINATIAKEAAERELQIASAAALPIAVTARYPGAKSAELTRADGEDSYRMTRVSDEDGVTIWDAGEENAYTSFVEHSGINIFAGNLGPDAHRRYRQLPSASGAVVEVKI